MSPILDMGVENRSDGIHRIHRTRLVSDGKVHVLVSRHLGKISAILDVGVENRSDGIHRIHRTRKDSDGNLNVLETIVILMFKPYRSCCIIWKLKILER